MKKTKARARSPGKISEFVKGKLQGANLKKVVVMNFPFLIVSQ